MATKQKIKPRNEAFAELRAQGALRTRKVQDKRRRQGRKAKHKGGRV